MYSPILALWLLRYSSTEEKFSPALQATGRRSLFYNKRSLESPANHLLPEDQVQFRSYLCVPRALRTL